jgi:Na+/phosphate symporter
LLFNVLGVLVFIILFNPFTSFINFLQNKYFLYNVKLTIAFSHFIFNFISVVLAYMFFDLFESFITKKVDKKEKNDIILS